MKKLILTFMVTGILVSFVAVNEAKAFDRSSCLEPGYLVTHFSECLEEFAECFEGYDGVWDAAAHTGDIITCIADFIEQETQDAIDDAIEAATGDEDSDLEEKVNGILDTIFGVNNTIHDGNKKLRDKLKNIREQAADQIKELINDVKEDRKDAREKLKNFVNELIEARKAGFKSRRN